jgi:hypothetical protein
MLGRVLPTRPGKLVRYVNYSVLQAALVTSNTLTHHLEFAQSLLRPDMEVHIGDGHPICQGLHALQLSNRPLVYQYSPKNESLLFAARSLVDLWQGHDSVLEEYTCPRVVRSSCPFWRGRDEGKFETIC